MDATHSELLQAFLIDPRDAEWQKLADGVERMEAASLEGR